MSEQRTGLARRRLRGDARLLLFQQDRLLLHDGDLHWSPASAAALTRGEMAPLFVGECGGAAYFALELNPGAGTETEAPSRSLRSLLFDESGAKLAVIARARQLLHWHRTHQYCGICGAATVLRENERVLECRACAQQYFPRINPCVIVLVTRGSEVLLARGLRFRGGYYSCLAGFVEIGETAEQAVEREVREESGVDVENIRYVESQCWPFPSQLMLGFLADYRAGEIVPEPDEIEDAGWFHIDKLPPVPSAEVSVAGKLIQGYARSLREAL